MQNPISRALVMGALLLSVLAPAAAAGPRPGDAAPLTPQARGALARDFVMKWGGYAQRIHGVPVGVWAKRMVPNFVAADPTNFRNALRRETFEGALSELAGTGHRLADGAVTERQARAGAVGTKDLAAVGAKLLGSTTNDLVFTPVTPCRLADTRISGGPLTADGTRSFLAVATSAGQNFSSQGGSNTNCNMFGVGASAIAINVTVVAPSSGGFATVYPFGTTRPLAASVNYTAGAIVNNTVLVAIPNPVQAAEFTIYSFASANYVVDIVGYFSPPQATAQQCTGTPLSTTMIGPGVNTFVFATHACPAGYQATSPYCWGGGIPGVYSTGSGFDGNNPGSQVFCAWQNTTAATQTVFAGTICCRVPGR